MMKVFGLTGGIGMGKSAAGQVLESKGILVIDTDVIARRLVEPGQPALEEIRARFGDSTILPDGSLDRSKLARVTFGNEAERRTLEAILHPRIRQSWRDEVARVSEATDAIHKLAVIVIPLLFETNAQRELDGVICVACFGASQLSRLRARGWADDEIQLRIRAQWPVEKKVAASHFVVWTEGPLRILEMQIDCLLRRLRKS